MQECLSSPMKFIFLTYLFKLMTPTTEKTSSLPYPPGNLGLPIVGETISFLNDANFQKKRLSKYGNIFKTSIFGRPTIVMVGAEAKKHYAVVKDCFGT
jgi:retinoid hydroxylase